MTLETPRVNAFSRLGNVVVRLDQSHAGRAQPAARSHWEAMDLANATTHDEPLGWTISHDPVPTQREA